MNHRGIAAWLSRWIGVEVLHEQMLDHLAEFDVRYSRVENALIDGDRRVGAGVQTADELRLLLARADSRGKLFFTFERGVRVLELARRLCELAGAGDPARVTRGDIARYQVYVNAIEQQERVRRISNDKG